MNVQAYTHDGLMIYAHYALLAAYHWRQSYERDGDASKLLNIRMCLGKAREHEARAKGLKGSDPEIAAGALLLAAI